MPDSESESDLPSFNQRPSKKSAFTGNNSQEGPMNYSEIIKSHLQDYEDINDDDFMMCEDEGKSFPNNYMHSSTNLTPIGIGSNFQAVIPPLITLEAYKAKTDRMIRDLRILQDNDTEKGMEFYTRHLEYVQSRFGGDRTYEDLNLLRNSFAKLHKNLKFEEYIQKNSSHWEEYFRAKEKLLISKMAGKKRRKANKGSIPM